MHTVEQKTLRCYSTLFLTIHFKNPHIENRAHPFFEDFNSPETI